MIVDSQSISYCLTFGRGEGHKENEFAVALRRENRVYGVTVFTKERAYSEDVIKRSHHFGSDIRTLSCQSLRGKRARHWQQVDIIERTIQNGGT